MKKNLIITAVIVALISMAFLNTLGFKIPQRDRHKDWVLLMKDMDANFEIENTKIEVNGKIIKIPDFGGFMILNNDDNGVDNLPISPIAIDNNGRLLKVFPKTNSFYVDSVNSRLILQELNATDKKQYYAYDLKKFNKTKLNPVKTHLMTETFGEYLHRKKIAEPKYEEEDKLEKLQADYIKDNESEHQFYQLLSPVTKLFINSENEYSYFQTDKTGQLYDIKKRESDRSKNNVRESLGIIFKNYNKTIKANNTYIKIAESDKPVVYSNFWTSGFLRFGFRQSYINYYSLKFGSKSFNFKDKEGDEFLTDFIKMPKNQTDTALFISYQILYRIHLRSNQ